MTTPEPARVLVVCTGNVSRSPAAQAMLATRLSARPIEVTSAGTQAMVGAPVDERVAALLSEEERGSLRDFRSRQLDEQLVSAADLVLTMTREHRAAVVSLVPTALRRTFTLTEFAELLPAARPGGYDTDRSRLAAESFPFDVPDPYGRSRRRYRAALEMIRAATDGVVAAVDAATVVLTRGSTATADPGPQDDRAGWLPDDHGMEE